MDAFCFTEEKCWFSTMQGKIETNHFSRNSVLAFPNRAAQILHRVVEKQHLFDFVLVNSMSEGIPADAKKLSGLNLIIVSFF